LFQFSSIFIAFTGSLLFGLTAVILKVGTQKQNLYVSLVVRAIASVPFLLMINIYRQGIDFFSPFTDIAPFIMILLSSTGLLLGDILLMHILKKKSVGIITPIIAINPFFTTFLLLVSGEATITAKIIFLSIAIILGVFMVTYNRSSDEASDSSFIDIEALFYGLLIAVIWGIMVFLDILILKEDNVDGLTFSAVKIMIVGIIGFILLIFTRFSNTNEESNFLNTRSIKFMLLAGFIGWVLGMIMVYSAFDKGPTPVITLIIGLNPLFSAIISILLKFEGINRIKAFGILLCISSSIILVI
jgi:drug/metabolite transporter (DMT)-like permease